MLHAMHARFNLIHNQFNRVEGEINFKGKINFRYFSDARWCDVSFRALKLVFLHHNHLLKNEVKQSKRKGQTLNNFLILLNERLKHLACIT